MKLLSILLLIGLISTSFASETPEQKGYRLAKTAYDASRGFIGDNSNSELVLIDPDGTQIIRKMNGSRLEKKDVTFMLNEFTKPLDVRGTKLLTKTFTSQDDQQWLYLPSLKRVKRITSSGKSSSFMGSEFTYEDFSSQEVEKYNYKFLKETKSKDGRLIHVYESYPKTDSGYSKQIIWMYDDIKNPQKIEFYNHRNELLKIAYFSNYKKYSAKGKTFNFANKIHMENQQTRKESIMIWKNRKIGVKFSARKFNPKSLKK